MSTSTVSTVVVFSPVSRFVRSPLVFEIASLNDFGTCCPKLVASTFVSRAAALTLASASACLVFSVASTLRASFSYRERTTRKRQANPATIPDRPDVGPPVHRFERPKPRVDLLEPDVNLRRRRRRLHSSIGRRPTVRTGQRRPKQNHHSHREHDRPSHSTHRPRANVTLETLAFKLLG